MITGCRAALTLTYIPSHRNEGTLPTDLLTNLTVMGAWTYSTGTLDVIV